jgi:hypothetical protein
MRDVILKEKSASGSGPDCHSRIRESLCSPFQYRTELRSENPYEEERDFRVRAALFADRLREALPRAAAAFFDWRESADLLAEALGSRFSARSVARERLREML